MEQLEITGKYAIDAMMKAGADKAECFFSFVEKQEINVEVGEITLIRTNFERNLLMRAIKDQRKSSIRINKTEPEAIDKAVESLMQGIESSPPDPANDIAENQPHESFGSGPDDPDMDGMYNRLVSFLAYTRERYPKLIIEMGSIDYTRVHTLYINTNDVNLVSKNSYYSFGPAFTSKDGEISSSFNYTGVSMTNLDKELQGMGSVDTLMEQSVEHLHPKPFPSKVEGQIVIAPDCLSSFISSILGYLSDIPIISGSSIYADKLGQQIAAPELTINSVPNSTDIAVGYHITMDGYAAQDMTIIENGVLKNFVLTQYGAKKSGGERAVSGGGAIVIEPGNQSLQEMIAGIEEGILLSRFSGGQPNDNGDFSGVAKNSFYIKDGKLLYPISETMISGNLAQLLMNITAISEERVDFGSGILPWIRAKGVVISGK